MEDNELSQESTEMMRLFGKALRADADVSLKPPSREMLDKAWEVVQAYQEWAPNVTWREMPVFALAAASKREPDKPIQLQADPSLGEHWTITQSVVRGKQAFYLIFECYPNAKERYVGRRVQVTYDDVTYDLGIVDAKGIAELRVAGTATVRSKATLVRISEEMDGE
jgi:hypothetical protein